MGKLQPYCLSPLGGTPECPQVDKVIGLAVDEDDTLYVLSAGSNVTLSVYTADGKSTHRCSLEFLNGQRIFNIKMNANSDKKSSLDVWN